MIQKSIPSAISQVYGSAFSPMLQYGGGYSFRSKDSLSDEFRNIVKIALSVVPERYIHLIKWVVWVPVDDSSDPLLRVGFVGWKTAK